MTKFFKTLFTSKNFYRIFTIFAISLILRCLFNRYLSIFSTLEYLDFFIILISSALECFFVEPYLDYDIYGYNPGTNNIKNLNLKDNVTVFALGQNPNNSGSPVPGPSGASGQSAPSSPPNTSEQNNTYVDFYYDTKPVSARFPRINSHSCGYNHYYIDDHRISLPRNNSLWGYNLDSETRRKLYEAIRHDREKRPTYIELPMFSETPIGLMSVGIKCYDNDPSKAISFYVKHFDLVNTEHMWDIWKKNQNGILCDYTEVNALLIPQLRIWRIMNKVTETDSRKFVTGFLEEHEGDPFRRFRPNNQP
jgi:hypothetical protein